MSKIRQKKRAEKEFVQAQKRYDFDMHKFTDRKWVHCPRCHFGFLLPKGENVVDYILWTLGFWVEVKESNSEGRWEWVELLPDGEHSNQRDFLIEHDGWLYLQLGMGRAHPNREKSGRSAYLIPFYEWRYEIEPYLLEHGRRSIRKETIGSRPGGDVLLAKWRLDWVDGKWDIPIGHPFWWELFNRLRGQLEFVKRKAGLTP